MAKLVGIIAALCSLLVIQAGRLDNIVGVLLEHGKNLGD